MNAARQNVTLAEPATYQIKVASHLDAAWSAWAEGMAIAADCNDAPVTTLTGTVDQAALHGLLRRLYALGLPLISVVRLEDE